MDSPRAAGGTYVGSETESEPESITQMIVAYDLRQRFMKMKKESQYKQRRRNELCIGQQNMVRRERPQTQKIKIANKESPLKM